MDLPLRISGSHLVCYRHSKKKDTKIYFGCTKINVLIMDLTNAIISFVTFIYGFAQVSAEYIKSIGNIY